MSHMFFTSLHVPSGLLSCVCFAALCGEGADAFISRRLTSLSTVEDHRGIFNSALAYAPEHKSTVMSTSSESLHEKSYGPANSLRPGILIVGFGGGNGVTVAAGMIANKNNITWEGPTGRQAPNFLGCITQLPSKGGSDGYRERYTLADATNTAFGGWDIRPTPLGEALYNARILDFDLVRQVREEMDMLKLLPGVWDPDFIGESQHASATHVVEDCEDQQSRLERLRKDIRNFRASEDVTGHITVIWSASVERLSEREFEEPSEVHA